MFLFFPYFPSGSVHFYHIIFYYLHIQIRNFICFTQAFYSFWRNMLHSVYRVTYLYYSVIGTLSTVITGWLFNCITGKLFFQVLIITCTIKVVSLFDNGYRKFLFRFTCWRISVQGLFSTSSNPAKVSISSSRQFRNQMTDTLVTSSKS